MTPTLRTEFPRFNSLSRRPTPGGPCGQQLRTSREPRSLPKTDDYLHAECSSAFFGFVDDLELHLRPSQNLIAVRSAARLGHGDFGVNRRRVENLRSLLINQGMVR
jgi:hypothetical protein